MDYRLPTRDELGFCNILICALGGDGANMAGKLLFKIGCSEFDLDGGYDAKYGSEKKGTPTDVSVRFCLGGTPIRQSGPTETPHFLVAFHADLIEPLDLGGGLSPNATCIINTIQPPDAMRESLRLEKGRIVCVDATKIAHECKSRLNMPLLAVLCHELGFPDERIQKLITQQWPRAASANLAAYDRALLGMTSADFEPKPDRLKSMPRRKITRGALGWRNMLNGGTIDALTHSTRGRDNRVAGRGHIPRFSPEACTSCGICLTVCSDPGGLLWREGRMVGIDPAFCKGCMRCVEVCPETKRGKALVVPQDGDFK